MGTRQLICVWWKGEWYLAQYGQWDGHPPGQGVKIFKFLSVARNIEGLKHGLENHIYTPTSEELEAIWAECEAWDRNYQEEQLRTNSGPNYDYTMTGINQLYPSLSRDTGAGIFGMVLRGGGPDDGDEEANQAGTSGAEGKERKKLPVRLRLEFANDTLYCEWAYVTDLDKEVLEVYGGSYGKTGESKHDGHRFKDVGPPDAPVPNFVCSLSFHELYLIKTEKEFLGKVLTALEERDGPDE
ncbi:hypothetical protein VTJ49DRAFT_2905 [Mycothermus thermophilus]|uniref:Uncharacterized protein n=1 Tax=Humicola insolens TaxID=85995 RepID=A0ABR3VMY0_HUMIN